MGTVRWRPAAAPHLRLSPCKPSCSLSATWGRPPPKCPRPAQLGVLCLSWVQGSRGTLPPALATGPSPGSQVVGRRSNPERPGRLPQPHFAALTALAAALALVPARWSSWQVQTWSPQLPGRPTPSRGHPGGDRARRPPLHTPRPRAAPALAGPGLCASRTRGDPGGNRTAGWGDGRGRGSVAWASPRPGQWKVPAAEAPSGRGGGLCRSLLPLARSRLVAGGGHHSRAGRGKWQGEGVVTW